MRIVWSLLAQRRLLEIQDHVAQDSPAAAIDLVDRLVERGEKLRNHANRGRLVLEAPGSGLRELLEGNYKIIYRARGKTVDVLTVFEGHRQIHMEELEE